MTDGFPHLLFVLSKLHSGGVAAVADAIAQKRPTVFAAMAGRRNLPDQALQNMAQVLRVAPDGFCDRVVEPWLARDDGDLSALEAIASVKLQVLARLRSSSEARGSAVPQHYFLIKVVLGDTDRFAVLRMRPAVSAAFIARKQVQELSILTVSYKHVPLLHALRANLASDDLLAELVSSLEQGGEGCAAQNLLERALQHTAPVAKFTSRRGPQTQPWLDDPRMIHTLAKQVAQDIYAIKVDQNGVADAVGKTHGERPVTVEIIMTRGDKIRLHAKLLESSPQHLLVLKLHSSQPYPAFEIVFDGPLDEVLTLWSTPRFLSSQVARESQNSHIEVDLKALRDLNREVPKEMGLRKR